MSAQPATPAAAIAADAVMAPRRRILYVESNSDGTIGGSFFSLLFLIAGIDRCRYQAVVAFSAPNALIPRFEAAGARVLICPIAPPVILSGRLGRLVARAGNLLRGFVLEPLRLARLLRREKIGLVHLNNSIIRNHPWMLAARFAGVPCMTHERGINPDFPGRARWLARKLDAVVCISQAVRSNFERCKLGDLRLVTIHNGLDPQQMVVRTAAADIRAELKVAADRRLIGIVGNVKLWKGQEVVIRAMGSLRERFPELVCLLIGDNSPDDVAYRDRIVQLIGELGLRERVLVTGYRANVADYVNALDVLIHASIDPEPFGRVLLEGMALHKPLVASRGGAVPEIVADGVTGRLFTPGDPADLARCLEAVLSDPAVAARMGEAGYRRLVDHFSISSNIAATETIYRSIFREDSRS